MSSVSYLGMSRLEIVLVLLVLTIGTAYMSHAFYVLDLEKYSSSNNKYTYYLTDNLNDFIYFIIIALAHFIIFILFAVYKRIPYLLFIGLELIVVVIFLITFLGGYGAIESAMLTNYGDYINFPIVRTLSAIALGLAIYMYIKKCKPLI